MKAIVLLLMAVLSSGPLTAQEWKQDTRAWYSFSASEQSLGMARNLIYDTCHKEVWAVSGQRIWRSRDHGLSWRHILVPINQEYRSRSQLQVDACNVLYQWDDLEGNYAFRMLMFDRENASWRELAPLGTQPLVRTFQWTGFEDSLVLIAQNLTRKKSLYYSTDLGVSWDSADNGHGDNAVYADLIYKVRPGTLTIKRDSGYVEVSSRPFVIRKPNVPWNTIAYRYADSTHIVAGLEGKPVDRLSISDNGGATWTDLDSLVFVNSSKVLRSRQGEMSCRVMRERNGIITIYMQSGDVVSTADAGITWYYRTGIGGLASIESAAITEDYAGNMIVCARGGWEVLLIPHSTDSVTVVSRGGPQFSSVLRLDSCTFAGAGPAGLYTSVDCGVSWRQSVSPPDLMESSTFHIVGVHPLFIDRLSVRVNGDYTMSSPENTAIYRLEVSSPTAEYLRYSGYSGYFDSNNYNEFSLVRPENVVRGWPEADLRGDTTIRYSTHMSFEDRDTVFRTPIGAGTVVASTLSVADDSEWIAVSDSVYFSENRGLTWTTRAGAGLPRDLDGRIYETSQIVRLSPTTLLLGFRGIRVVGDSDTTDQRPGGLYRSDDNGASWTRSDAGMGSQTYVWFIAKLDESVVLCAAGQVLADTANEGYNQTGGTVMRSTDAGRTWSMVYDEPRGRPAFWGRREILATSATRVLHASMESGVVESTDAGLSWHELGDMPLYYRFINDIEVDSRGTIYAGTDKGLFTLTPDATSVEADDDHLKFASVWAYPTPAGDQLTVRINNANLMQHGATLTMVSIYGQLMRDLSASVSGAPGRQEFIVSTADLPEGVYLIVLAHSKASETCKVMVRR